MPLGAFRLNTLARYVATGGGATELLNTSTNIDWNYLTYQHDKINFVGMDTNSNPVFLWGYKDTSGAAYVILFRINSDLTLTEGTPVQIFASGVSTANSAGGYPDSTTGICVYYQSAGVYAKAFTYNINTLAIGTPGSQVQVNTTSPTAGFSYATYMRNNYFMAGWRRSGMVFRQLTVSGTTITLGANTLIYSFGDGVYQEATSHANSGSLLRAVASNGNAASLGAAYWNGTSASTSYVFGTFLTMGGLNQMRVRTLDDTSKCIAASARTNVMKARAATINWPTSGTGAPTATHGTEITLTHAGSNLGLCNGGTDIAYVAYLNTTDSNWYYSKITASGTTLTEATPVALGLSESTFTALPSIEYVSGASAGNILVGLVDNSASVNPHIFVKVVS